MYEADREVSMFVVTGSNLWYPDCLISPYICTDAVGDPGPCDPDIIILPVNKVLPIRVLLPVWVVEPVMFKLPVKVVVPIKVLEPVVNKLPVTV